MYVCMYACLYCGKEFCEGRCEICVRIYWLPTEGRHKTMVGVHLGCPEVVEMRETRDCGDWCARFFTIIVCLVNSVTTSTEHQKKRTTQTPATHVARSHLACCKSHPRSPEGCKNRPRSPEESSVARGTLASMESTSSRAAHIMIAVISPPSTFQATHGMTSCKCQNS